MAIVWLPPGAAPAIIVAPLPTLSVLPGGLSMWRATRLGSIMCWRWSTPVSVGRGCTRGVGVSGFAMGRGLWLRGHKNSTALRLHPAGREGES